MPPAGARPPAQPLLRGRGVVFLAVGLVAGLLAIGLVVASQVGSGGGTKAAAPASKAAGAAETSALLRGIPQSGSVLGKPGAPLTLIEFADLQCPYCARYAVDVLPTVVREYVRTGKVKLEFRGLAFVGPDSETALRTVLAAGQQDRLWHVLDLLYRNQGAENSGWVSEELVRSVGTSVPGLDGATMLTARDSSTVTDQIADDQSLASSAGIAATPTFLTVRAGTNVAEPLHVSKLDPAAFRTALDVLLAR
jgi:protein-disulfide isomerase